MVFNYTTQRKKSLPYTGKYPPAQHAKQISKTLQATGKWAGMIIAII